MEAIRPTFRTIRSASLVLALAGALALSTLASVGQAHAQDGQPGDPANPVAQVCGAFQDPSSPIAGLLGSLTGAPDQQPDPTLDALFGFVAAGCQGSATGAPAPVAAPQ